MSFARRDAQIGKFALIVLKYIATHDLTGVLQPISSIRKNSVYIPKKTASGMSHAADFHVHFLHDNKHDFE
jgi:hypothetical protein